MNRRRLLGAALAAPLALTACARASQAPPPAHVVIVGAGFAGATTARYLARWAPSAKITLVAAPGAYYTCPFSNAALVGLRTVDSLAVDPGRLAADGRIEVLRAIADDVDPVRRVVRFSDGRTLAADLLVLAPGVDFAGERIEGYDAVAAERFPHGWKAGAATTTLAERLRAVPDDGLVVLSVPENPYRCPPGPYERASLFAWWLARERPRAEVVILDAKDGFTKDSLFRAAWAKRYPNLRWVSRSDGGTLRAVDGRRGVLETDFDRYTPDLACVIPPQHAGALVRRAGLDGGRGWCAIDAATFEVPDAPGVHVIGDAAIAAPMPKSAFAANSQGKALAAVLAAQIDGSPVPTPTLANTCYSLVAPDAGISVTARYGVRDGALHTLERSNGVSPLDGDADLRAREAAHARGWYDSIVADSFGS